MTIYTGHGISWQKGWNHEKGGTNTKPSLCVVSKRVEPWWNWWINWKKVEPKQNMVGNRRIHLGKCASSIELHPPILHLCWCQCDHVCIQRNSIQCTHMLVKIIAMDAMMVAALMFGSNGNTGGGRGCVESWEMKVTSSLSFGLDWLVGMFCVSLMTCWFWSEKV